MPSASTDWAPASLDAPSLFASLRAAVVGTPTDPLEKEARGALPRRAVAVPPAVRPSLDNPLRARFGEGRPLGPTPQLPRALETVRVHDDPAAARVAEALSAEAFTVGEHLFFARGRFAPGQPDGHRVLAHELVHVLQQREGRAPAGGVQRLSSTHGQHVSGGQADLTADLTSPVVVNRFVHLQATFGYIPGYVPFSGPPALSPFPYEWVVTDRDTGSVVARTSTQTGEGSIRYPRVGHFRITCNLRGAAGSGTVSMDQDAAAEDAWLSANLSTSQVDADTLREMVDDLRQYIVDSAASTGANGITARFLAAILSEEISNTDPSLFFIDNRGARGSEIHDVGVALDRRDAGQAVPVSDIDHSVGVAQVKLSTAAQLQNVIPWTEQDPTHRGPARARIRSTFAGLSVTRQRDLLTLLRWPKSNVQTAADLLVRLKNRPNRYPTVTRRAFGSTARACQIIATEYNLGASTSTEAAAAPSGYGVTIWARMTDPVIAHYFPNT